MREDADYDDDLLSFLPPSLLCLRCPDLPLLMWKKTETTGKKGKCTLLYITIQMFFGAGASYWYWGPALHLMMMLYDPFFYLFDLSEVVTDRILGNPKLGIINHYWGV